MRTGKVEVDNPPDPRTGARVRMLERLDFVHAVCRQITDRGFPVVRYGPYTNRKRRGFREAMEETGEAKPTEAIRPAGEEDEASPRQPAPPGSAEARRRSAWARMLRDVFAIDPLLCSRCRNVEMKVVAWVTDPVVIDRIREHRREQGIVSPFEPGGACAAPAA